MRSRFFSLYVTALLMTLPACSPRVETGAKPIHESRIVPPRIKSAGPLEYRAPARGLNVTVEVPVDEYGRANIIGMHFTGNIPQATRSDIESWISRASFYPAMQAGTAVAGTFTMRLRTR